MNIPVYALNDFYKFCEEVMGVKWEPATTCQTGELRRAVIRERLLVVRSHELRREDDQIEVFCSNPEITKELEVEFLTWCQESKVEDKGMEALEGEVNGKETDSSRT